MWFDWCYVFATASDLVWMQSQWSDDRGSTCKRLHKTLIDYWTKRASSSRCMWPWAYVCMHLMEAMRLCLMTIDVWKWRTAGSRQDGGREKEQKWGIVEGSREEACCCCWRSITQEDTLITSSQLRLTFIARWTRTQPCLNLLTSLHLAIKESLNKVFFCLNHFFFHT